MGHGVRSGLRNCVKRWIPRQIFQLGLGKADETMSRAAQIALAPFILALALYPTPTYAAAPAGTICIAPVTEECRALDKDYRNVGNPIADYSYQFSVKIDDRPPVSVPTGSVPKLVQGLDLAKRHRVVIYDGDKPIASFWFTLKKRGSPNLCLFYKGGYQTWSLLPPPHGAKWCQCSGKSS